MPGSVINVSHAAVAVRAALAEALQARWREIDAAQRPAPPSAPPVKRSAPAPSKRPAKKSAKPAVAPGSLVLSPEEVLALDGLLATHPALKDTEASA